MLATVTRYRTALDLSLEVMGWLLLGLLWILTLRVHAQLPDLIHIHFKFSGITSKQGDKVTLFFFPITATIMCTGLSLLGKYPGLFSSEGRTVFYFRQLIRWLKISIALVFSLGICFIYLATLGEAGEYRSLFFPAVIAIVGMPATYYFYRLLSPKNKA
jgi:hypothetical protein